MLRTQNCVLFIRVNNDFFLFRLHFFFHHLPLRRGGKSRVIQPLVDRETTFYTKAFIDLPLSFLSFGFFFNKINDVFDRPLLFF